MAEEQTVSVENIETPQIIPDEVLKEIEKISKHEKDIKFLQARQGSVELAVTQLREEKEAVADSKNIISEETKEEKPKKDKDVINNDNKLKPQLDSIEKKRYENIGAEFAKGAEKIFKEIEKAKELQNKMKTKDIKKIEEDQKQEKNKEEEKKKKKISFMKLGLAIAAVGAVLYLFRDTIDKFIPGYKDGTEGFYGWIKNKSKDVFGDIVDGIVGVFRHIFDGLFNGDGGLKHTLNIFFLSTLPDVIFQSGLVLMKGFGAKVEQVSGQWSGEENSAAVAAMDWAKKEQERLREETFQNAQLNRQILQDVFSTDGQIEAAQRRSGLDSIVMQGQQFQNKVASILGITEERFTTQASYGSNFMSAIHRNKDVIEGEFTKDNSIKLARIIYEQQTGKKSTDADGKDTQDFQKFFNKNWNPNINSETWQILRKANEEYVFRNRVAKEMESDRQILDEVGKAAEAQVRRSGIGFVEGDNSKLTLNIEPVSIAQDSLAAQCSQLFTTLKDLFSANVIETYDFADKSVNFINKVIESLVMPIVTSFEIFQKFIDDSFDFTAKKVGTGSNISNFSQSSPTSTSQPIQISNFDDSGVENPIILVDLDLNTNIISKLETVFNNYTELLKTMTKTNDTLRNIKNISITKPTSSQKGTDKTEIYSNLEAYAKQQIAILNNRVNKVEEYLENNDTDDDSTKNFAPIQAASTAS